MKTLCTCGKRIAVRGIAAHRRGAAHRAELQRKRARVGKLPARERNPNLLQQARRDYDRYMARLHLAGIDKALASARARRDTVMVRRLLVDRARAVRAVSLLR